MRREKGGLPVVTERRERERERVHTNNFLPQTLCCPSLTSGSFTKLLLDILDIRCYGEISFFDIQVNNSDRKVIEG